MSDPILRVSGLKKTFSKNGVEINVIKGIDIDIYEGDFITIMGPSGAGKSTFLHILGTLDKPSEGDIFFRDRNVKGFTEDEESKFRNEKVGFVFQFYHLLQVNADRFGVKPNDYIVHLILDDIKGKPPFFSAIGINIMKIISTSIYCPITPNH
jgi:predicted ABC-type transport system involved in lysophospholipase L1 biosynthesis ATPase subunit